MELPLPKRQRADLAGVAEDKSTALLTPGMDVALLISWEGNTSWLRTKVKECPASNPIGVTFEVDGEVFKEGMQQLLTTDIPCAVLNADYQPIVDAAPLHTFL